MKAGQFYKVAELVVGTHGVTLHENINGVIFSVHHDEVEEHGITARILGFEWFFTNETLNHFIQLPEVDQRRYRGKPGMGTDCYYMVYPSFDPPSEVVKKAKQILENRVELYTKRLAMAKEMASHELQLNSTFHCKG